MAALLAFLLLLLLLLSGGAAGDDVAALLEFKKGIAGRDRDRVLGSWSRPATTEAGSGGGGGGCPASWRGVACDGGAVVGVALDGLGLAGELKLATLAGMRALQNLSLAGNAFSGRLPPGIGSLSSLRHLDLSRNRFYGPVPARLANLSGLVHLDLSRNNFTSAFPTDGIQQLQNLRRVDVRGNSFWGNATDLLAKLRNAEHVDLSDNLFTGTIDLDLRSLSSIGNTVRYLNLSHNNLDGGFFRNETVGAFKNLAVLDLSNNGLAGTVPRLDAWFSLEFFSVAGNGLFGMMPETLLQNSMRLVEVDLSRNGFSGNLVDFVIYQSRNPTTYKFNGGDLFNISYVFFLYSLDNASGQCFRCRSALVASCGSYFGRW
jgi:Ran GTPase-activating protein (RanGAP) involved in mRNA processing and transport